MHFEALQQLSPDRGLQLRQEAAVERLAAQARGRRLQRQRRLALNVAFEKLLRHRLPHARDTTARTRT